MNKSTDNKYLCLLFYDLILHQYGECRKIKVICIPLDCEGLRCLEGTHTDKCGTFFCLFLLIQVQLVNGKIRPGPRYFFQLLGEDTKMLPGQMSLACSGSAPGFLPRWMCPEHLPSEVSRGDS